MYGDYADAEGLNITLPFAFTGVDPMGKPLASSYAINFQYNTLYTVILKEIGDKDWLIETNTPISALA